MKLSLLLLAPLYQDREILLGALEFVGEFDLALGESLVVELDLLELVLQLPALVDDLLPLQLSLLHLEGHRLVVPVQCLDLLLQLLDLVLGRLDHVLHLRFQNRGLVSLLLSRWWDKCDLGGLDATCRLKFAFRFLLRIHYLYNYFENNIYNSV